MGAIDDKYSKRESFGGEEQLLESLVCKVMGQQDINVLFPSTNSHTPAMFIAIAPRK